MRSLLQKLNTHIIEVIDVDDNRTLDNDNQDPRNQKYQNIIQTQQQIIQSPCFCYGCRHAQDNNQTSNHCQWENLWIALIQEPNRIELMLHREQNQVPSTGEVCWKY